MKTERIETLVDSFVDENGDTRHFVIAAISEVLPKDYTDIDPNDCPGELTYEVIQYDDDCNDTSCGQVVKCLRLGWAICNPIDKFNEEIGKQIAIGRARKNNEAALWSTRLGYINTKVVRAFLEQEAQFFKENPQIHIAGYKRKK